MNQTSDSPISATVFIVDEDPDIHSAVSSIVHSAGLATEAYSSGADFLEHFDSQKPGCLVMDLASSGTGGIEVQQQLHLKNILLPIIFLTKSSDVSLVTKAIREGAVDVLLKPFAADLLLRRIQEAVQLDLSNCHKRVQRTEIQGRIETLTDREREVMRLLASGDSAKQIGQKLSISSKTVDNHRAKVLEKMGVDNPTQLARQLALLE